MCGRVGVRPNLHINEIEVVVRLEHDHQCAARDLLVLAAATWHRDEVHPYDPVAVYSAIHAARNHALNLLNRGDSTAFRDAGKEAVRVKRGPGACEEGPNLSSNLV